MILGALLFAAGLFVARFAARPGRWLKVAGVVLFLGWPAAQIVAGSIAGMRAAEELAGG